MEKMLNNIDNKNDDFDVDYSLVLQTISSYLVGVKDFFGKYENTYSVGLIPDGHHIYTGTLKAAGYKILKPAKTLVLVGEGAINDKICVLGRSVDYFMGKKRNLDKKIMSLLKGLDFVQFVQHEFDRISSELPFVRILSNYENIVYMEVGDKLSKLKLVNLFLKLSIDANLMFISGFHRDKDMESCKKLDGSILDIEFVNKNKEFFLIEIFLKLAKKKKKVPNLLAYLNIGDISMDKDVTNGFGCVVV